MRKVIAVMNMTLDGYCDHTAGIADEELHDHYTQILKDAGVVLYGRKTYDLMKFWPSLVANPSGNKSIDDFAMVMDKVPKILFSRTVKEVDWHSTTLAKASLKEEVNRLKNSEGGDIILGSPSLIVQTSNLGLIDEYQLCIHPVVLGKGLALFKDISEQFQLKLRYTKVFDSGVILCHYSVEE